MPKFLTALLIIFAITAALAVSMHTGMRLITVASIGPLTVDNVYLATSNLSSTFPQVSLARSCYPFNWQVAKRVRLEELLETPSAPPEETDTLGLARYAEYARLLDWQDVNYELVMSEGMRRDPDNALYHYLLAYRWIKLSLEGEYDKDAPAGTYAYRVKDRNLLDRGMQELAAGMKLPLDSRRYDLIAAQLNAMPKARFYEEQIRETALLATALFPEFGKMRTFTQVNGFYLSLLLAEDKRAEAEPFLHTGERLVIQISEDRIPTLVGMLVALAIHKIGKENDPVICREYGYTTEAAEMERRYEIISGNLHAWKETVDHEKIKEKTMMNGGILANVLLPIFGDRPWFTPESLRPSRRVECAFFGGFAVSLLPLLFVGLLAYSALKYWRWRLALAGEEIPPHDMRLSGAEWARVLLIGVLLPLALFFAYIAIPAISFLSRDIVSAIILFGITASVVMLWMLIVPATLAAGSIWRRSLVAGIIEVHRPGVGRFLRGLSSLLSLFWAFFFMRSLLVLPVFLALVLAASSLLPDDNVLLGFTWVGHLLASVLLVGLALLPAAWERNHLDCAQHFLALSRAMIPVYAVLALYTAALYPALLKLESHYLRQDKVMTTMRTGDTIAFTQAEGRLVLELRKTVLEGAKQLELEQDDEKETENHRGVSHGGRR